MASNWLFLLFAHFSLFFISPPFFSFPAVLIRIGSYITVFSRVSFLSFISYSVCLCFLSGDAV